MNKFAPLSPKVVSLLHGADYNPEQWENYPGIIDKDIAMMKQAKCNVMSVGIFSWSKLEPREGEFNFAWLDSVIESYMRREFIFSSPRRAAPGLPGCRRNTRKCCVSGAIASRHCTAGGIITA
jgi:hypothetical protein